MQKFVHLRVHSAYSLAQSTIKVSEMVSLAKKNDMPALGICDNHNLFGSLEFSDYAAKSGVKPIVGCKLNIKNPLKDELDKLIVYAKNEAGLRNLIKLNSDSFLFRKDLKKDPYIEYSDLYNMHNGLILLTGAHEGTFGKFLVNGEKDKAVSFIKDLHNVFHSNLYVELVRQDSFEDLKIEEDQINIAYDLNLPIVATNPVLFSEPNMYEAFDSLYCLATEDFVQNESRIKPSENAYFKSNTEMNELFSDITEAVENTMVIAERCSAMMHSRPPMLPKFNEGSGESEDEIFARYAREGLRQRLEVKKAHENISDDEFKEIDKEYNERLDFEINVISQMKFPGYFLIVSDFMKWSKKNGIPVGPGRGSGAGSLVAWSLEITNLDPIRFGLLFERFLNPERVSMPDFDIDFCQDRRDEVINYVKEKYGDDRVAQIITFGKLQARAVLRDVGRVLQVELGQVNEVCKMVPNNPANPVTLEQAIDIEPNIQRRMAESRDIDKMVKIALKLEGLYRHTSTHAAGVVIADKPLTELVPMYFDEKAEMPVVQYSMKYAEMAGLVKFDFLGLKTLTVIQFAINLLKEQGITIDIDNIGFNDKKTYELLSQGEAIGVFQFESSGMRDALRKLRPDSIEDLIALGALYRPGPMENIPTYIARKHKLEEPDYIHPKLENVLKETFGVIIYQEQVMQIAQILAGYTLGGADLLRRAMGKKIKAEMDAQRAVFVEGSVNNGISAEQADQIFDLVDKFAGYGFNKSHAAAYAVIAYQTAFLKANYMVEFLVGSLNYDIHDTDKIYIFLQEARKFNIEVLAPCVNKSYALFTIEFKNGKKCIRYALSAIKNISKQVSDVISKEREFGSYNDLSNFLKRMKGKGVNKKVIENLAKSGSFDEIHSNRQQIIISTEKILKFLENSDKKEPTDQISLFSINTKVNEIKLDLEKSDEFVPHVKLANEFAVFGFYFAGHPLNHFEAFIDKYNLANYSFMAAHVTEDTTSFTVAAVPIDIKIKASAKKRFGYLTVSDETGSYELGMFNKEIMDKFDNNMSVFTRGLPVVMRVDAKQDEGGIRFFLQEIDYLVNFIIGKSRSLTFKTTDAEIASFMKDMPIRNDGLVLKIEMNLKEDKKKVLLKLPELYKPDAVLIEQILEKVPGIEVEYN